MPIFRRWSGPNLLTNSSVPGKIITCTDLGKGRGVRSNLDRLGFVTREISQHKKVSNFRPFITISTVADDWRWNPRNSEGGRERMANWGDIRLSVNGVTKSNTWKIARLSWQQLRYWRSQLIINLFAEKKKKREKTVTLVKANWIDFPT